jgi:C1A family cysteine protease
MPEETLNEMHPSEFGLGDRAVDDQHYDAHRMTYEALDSLSTAAWDIAAIPEFDARSRGWVTPAKNQGRCGSCWAHAAVGTIESRILKDGGPRYDLSEQQQISCNLTMQGCCGGSGSSLLFYYKNRPYLESSAPYAEGLTKCPTQRTKTCGNLHGVPVKYLATGYYTVDHTVDAMKKSLTEHGPCYFRYDVYDDFYSHWTSAAAGSVYVQKTGNLLGGHAVLLIGWSDSKGAWLIKNSWGATTGPSHDGTFWMAYTGHAHDLKFQMFNIVALHKTR